MDFKDGKDKKEFKVFDFPGSGTALTMYNLDEFNKKFCKSMYELWPWKKMASLFIN